MHLNPQPYIYALKSTALYTGCMAAPGLLAQESTLRRRLYGNFSLTTLFPKRLLFCLLTKCCATNLEDSHIFEQKEPAEYCQYRDECREYHCIACQFSVAPHRFRHRIRGYRA